MSWINSIVITVFVRAVDAICQVITLFLRAYIHTHIHATPFSYTYSDGSQILLVRGVLQLDSTLGTTESVLNSASVKTILILFLMASPEISWLDFHTCSGRLPRFKVGNPGFNSFDIHTPLISWSCAIIPHTFLCCCSSAVPTPHI